MSDTSGAAETSKPTDSAAADEGGGLFAPLRLIRVAIAGVLMGTANLIPGVSGGTMVLAMGVYQEFIDSVADITALRFSLRRIVFLGVLGACAVASILGLAGLILYLLFHHTSVMFALFMGLTLGGAPLLARMLKPVRADVVIAIAAGFLLMVGVFMLKGGEGLPHNTGMDFVSGVVGSTTMVLPGISGSYMLLVMDQYERVVGAVDDLKLGLKARDLAALKSCLMIVIPVGIGAVLGIVGLSNLLKYLLHHFERPTLGVLLGILLGSVIGLWPFGKQPSEKALERRSVAELREFGEAWQIPELERAVEEAQRAAEAQVTDPEQAVHQAWVTAIHKNWDHRQRSSYAPDQIALAAGLVVAGFVVTFMLSRGRKSGEEDAGGRGALDKAASS